MVAARHRRAGMTLVELLVAVAVLGLLAVAVLPSFATTTERNRARETVRLITSFIAQAQGRAVGQRSPAGFGIVKTGGTARNPAIDLVPATVPEPYRGNSAAATVSLAPTTPPSLSMNLTFSAGDDPAAHLGCRTGDLIRFNGRGPWFEFTVPAGATGGFQCRLQSTGSNVGVLAGQTALNTVWPDTGPPGGPPTQHTFEILRTPRRAGAAISLGESRCIDVFWSSAGQNQLMFAAAEIYVLFDSSGSVRNVVADANRFAPDGEILLLVGRVDRAGQDPVMPLPVNPSDDSVGANWQHADSTWISIDPLSGACRTAPCDAAAATQPPPPGLSDQLRVLWSLRQSQNLIRSDVLPGT